MLFENFYGCCTFPMILQFPIVFIPVSIPDTAAGLPSVHSVEEFVPDDALDASFLDDTKDVKAAEDKKQNALDR